MERLEGKRVLVTGASSGIGRAVAIRFAAEGASVAIGGRNVERTMQTRQLIEQSGASAIEVLGDVSVEPAAREVVEHAVDALGGLDAVINNAGVDVVDWAPVDEWDVIAFDSLIAGNLRGPFLIAKYSLPHLVSSGDGAIVHMSSVCAQTVWAGDCAYGMSKAALNMLSDHIAVEYGTRGVRSNTLMPGVIVTELHRTVMDGMEDGGAFERELLTRHPIGRFGTVEEIADACVFLCSGEARFMTGANIAIDGGYSRI